ncbi:MAG: hypothetical protein OXG30_05275 [bacterium]|nr:hypothetical protein [bacterium]
MAHHHLPGAGVLFIGIGIPVGIDADKKTEECRDAPLSSDWLDICIEARDANDAADALILGGIGWFVLAVVFFLIFITRDKHKRQLGPASS